MNKIIDIVEKQTEKAILVSVDTGEFDAQISIDELEELAQTAGLDVIAQVIQKKQTIEAATYVGEGKLEEISHLCKQYEADLLIFDHELSASQIRNIEKETNTRVIDRTMLILDIFAMRAVTSEGKLQVELAQLKHRLPRLVGMGLMLSRQGSGGSKGTGVGTRGPGETQLENDRRHIRRRIDKLSEQLKELETRREFSRIRRKKDNIQIAAIVGYTNVGKSTLLNKLTNADVLAENKLFATLDPTSRAVTLPDGRQVVLVDTVGMIRRLPHQLVEAFKSTLEEAANADVILHVCDISDPDVSEKAKVVETLLAELKCSEIPSITVFNKKDIYNGEVPQNDDSCAISAQTGDGIENLLFLLTKKLVPHSKKLTLQIPYDKAKIIAKLRDGGKILGEEFNEDGIKITAIVENKNLHLIEDYIIK